eukprot:COSAG05_NODE_23654_length_256_cov_0.980892_1_plen_84_part_01
MVITKVGLEHGQNLQNGGLINTTVGAISFNERVGGSFGALGKRQTNPKNRVTHISGTVDMALHSKSPRRACGVTALRLEADRR